MHLLRSLGTPKVACSHTSVRKAYYLGLPGEGYVCLACGEAVPKPAAEPNRVKAKH
jgi:hypothetical protein